MSEKQNLPDDFTIDGDLFKVLINAEGQHSIWPAGQVAPAGWTVVGCQGSKAECLAYVDANWLDMRPISLQKAMDAGSTPDSLSI